MNSAVQAYRAETMTEEAARSGLTFPQFCRMKATRPKDEARLLHERDLKTVDRLRWTELH